MVEKTVKLERKRRQQWNIVQMIAVRATTKACTFACEKNDARTLFR
jgi:hypothetical protein